MGKFNKTGKRGMPELMPIYYDLEDNSQTKLGKAKLTEIAERFCETIKKRQRKRCYVPWLDRYRFNCKLR